MERAYQTCEYLFEHPELGDQEVLSSQYLCQQLKELGFNVEYPYLQIPTAFRAEYKNGSGKKVCFLAEYDALPGYGINKDENAHACGHNWIAASCIGTAEKMLEHLDEFQGTIVIIGTPAEETFGRKIDLVERGAFKDIDAVLQMHLGSADDIDVHTLAMNSLEFTFTGKASHASSFPELGINALDGVQLMFAGVNALRGHIPSDCRIYGIVKEGGQACNVVCDHAVCQFYIRSKTRAYLKTLTQRIIDCAKGASLMSGAAMDYRYFENSFDELVYDEKLREIFKKHALNEGMEFYETLDGPAGSSDIGNVSQVCPTVYCEIDVHAQPKVNVHEEDFLPYVHGNNARITLDKACRILSKTALEIFKIQ